MEKEIEITIKAGNQKVPDFKISCNSGWSVTQLKQHISETYPTKPSIEDQRLIYSGRLLTAKQTLHQIFLKDVDYSADTGSGSNKPESFTIHLVQRNAFVHPKSQSAGQSTPQSSSPNSFNDAPPMARPNVASPMSNGSNSVQNNETIQESNPTSEMRYRFVRQAQTDGGSPNLVIDPADIFMNFRRLMAQHNVPSPNEAWATQSSDNVSPVGTNQLAPEQINLFEQMAQLVAQQVSTLSSQNSPFQLPPIVSTAQTTSGHITVTRGFQNRGTNPDVNQNNGNLDEAGAVEPVNGLGEIGLGAVNNPLGGVRDEVNREDPVGEPGEQADIIDLLYHSLRGLVLAAAIYTNSSVYKLVFVLAFLVFCYYARKSMVNRQQRVARENQQQAPNPEDASNRNLENQPNDPNRPPDPHETQVETRLPFLRIFFSVVTSFIISLVPETV
ncbi:Homocysteine-responsive endoplasmic reticulum-resident ubiquitin-like domain member 2 protein [Fragariocoptes setiger]|uniref:Homocysteine-responsive endoplasmic reticulum-resident ubiquitin-like domain member 2 protein n=1 Tax=Fragariocoptes setiger TaxID=1670756 RepID=A0ABQ7S8L5_9ACAR|nr:Homocysteine-responsive endoplasmic reticulum-resident ubiquitin-like domain member 2 protein [Fragariocoptes setiger]